jgi:hypothetical protein
MSKAPRSRGGLRWQRMARIGAVAGNAAEAGARRG